MRVVFMGTPDFAAESLKAVLDAGCEVVGVFTQPDRPKGRGMKLAACETKALALERGLDVYQPASVRTPEALELMRSLAPDILCVVAYGKILPDELLAVPKYGAVNVHGSLLPQYRGAAPIQRAIMDGNKLTGITIMRMERGLDTGPMLSQRALGIGIDDTAATLHDELANLGGRLMVEVLQQYADGDPTTPIPQDDALATHAAKLTKADGHIGWDEDAEVLHARMRGVTPWPGAQTVFLLPNRDPLPVLLQPGRPGETYADGPRPTPGTIVGLRGGKLLIACRDALYELSTLKPAGSKPMSAEAFWNGYCRPAGKGQTDPGRAVSPADA